MIFLAAPYSHPNEAIRRKRFVRTTDCLIWLLSKRLPVYSPITYGHACVLYQNQHPHKFNHYPDLGVSWETWAGISDNILYGCTDFWILTLDGWYESNGLQRELEMAKAGKKTIKYIHHLQEAEFSGPFEELP